MTKNPRGGRPQAIGSGIYTTLERPGSLMEITNIQEDTSFRLFLGYCPCGCGNKIVAGEKRFLILCRFGLDKLGITSLEQLKERIKETLMTHQPVKKSFWEDV